MGDILKSSQRPEPGTPRPNGFGAARHLDPADDSLLIGFTHLDPGEQALSDLLPALHVDLLINQRAGLVKADGRGGGRDALGPPLKAEVVDNAPKEGISSWGLEDIIVLPRHGALDLINHLR